MLPSHFAEIKGYQHVYNFITKHLDMQFNDVRGMMKLPCPNLESMLVVTLPQPQHSAT